VQADDGLAGAGGAADASWSVEVAPDELRLSGVEECHPVLDGGFEDTIKEVIDNFVVEGVEPEVGERLELGVIAELRERSRFRVQPGEDCRGDDRLRIRERVAGNDREVLEHRAEDGVHALRRQPRLRLGDVGDEVPRADDVNRSDARAHMPLTGQSDDRVYLAGSESDLGECLLRVPRHVGEGGDALGHVLLAAGDVAVVDSDLPPGLRVHDEDTARADDDHVDLRRAATRPTTVGDQVVPDACKRSQERRCLALGAVSDVEPASARVGFVGLSTEFPGPSTLA
jgi:hypothetical protein